MRFPNLAIFPLVAAISAAPAWAAISLDPYIANSSFELLSSPLTNCGTASGPATPLYCNGTVAGWSIESGPGAVGGAGTVQLSGQTPAGLSQTQLLPANGNNAAYINNLDTFLSSPLYTTQWEAISQTLNNVTLQANTTYSLTYDVARRADDAGGHFRVQVNAGSDYWILAGDTTNFTAGQWVSETLTFTTPSGFGSAVPTVYLVNDGSDKPFDGSNYSVSQVEFDLPEPAEFLPLTIMLACLGLAGFRLRSRIRRT